MAILKGDSYNSWEVDTGDTDIQAEMKDQLKITGKEMSAAINAENLCDRIFARILTNRSRQHKALLDKIPGASAIDP